MERLNHVADVMFEHGMITDEELQNINCIPVPHNKVLIDSARRKGDATSNMLMETWESYPLNQK